MSRTPEALLEAELGRAPEPLELPALGARPCAAPTTEEEVARVLRLAARERWTVLPLGRGSKLAWLPPLERVDLVLSTRALTRVLAYEPGDGTLTAQAGARLSELEDVVAAGGHALTPRVARAEHATLGGVCAAGQSGLDRLAVGPVRHHVLGMRVALADGTLTKTGGRLVKNVTGYDLHRLYTGSFGTLCVILEVSLRLFPAPECVGVLESEHASLDEARRALAQLASLGLRPQSFVVDPLCERPRSTLVLAGREEPVRAAVAQATERLAPLQILEGDEARARERALRDGDWSAGRWAPLVLRGPVSSVPHWPHLFELAGAESVALHPGVAEASLFPAGDIESSARDLLESQARELSVRVTWREPGAPAPTSPRAELLTRRLKAALDPDGRFAHTSLTAPVSI